MILKQGHEYRAMPHDGKTIWRIYRGGRCYYIASPYSPEATQALRAAFPQYWTAIRDYGYAHPALVPFINEDPMLIVSLVEVGKTRWLTIPQGKNDGYYNGVTLPYYWADLGRIDMNVQWLPSETSNGILWFNCWNGTKLVAPYWGTSWTSGFANVAVIGDTNYRNEGERSISFTCSDKSNYAHILGWDLSIAPTVKATHFSIYATDKTTKLMELVPFISQGEGVFLDLLSGTIIRNNDKGSFTIAITDK